MLMICCIGKLETSVNKSVLLHPAYIIKYQLITVYLHKRGFYCGPMWCQSYQARCSNQSPTDTNLKFHLRIIASISNGLLLNFDN